MFTAAARETPPWPSRAGARIGAHRSLKMESQETTGFAGNGCSLGPAPKAESPVVRVPQSDPELGQRAHPASAWSHR